MPGAGHPAAAAALPAEFVRNVAGYFPNGARWLAELPARVDALAERWRLREVTAFEGLSFNFVASARRDGEAVVLKVSADPAAACAEAAWLRQRRSPATVRLLASDRGACLLARVSPGEPLAPRDAAQDEAAARAIAALMRRLSCDAPAADAPFRAVAGDVQGLDDYLRRFDAAGPVAADLVRAAAAAWEDLIASAPPACLLHGDFHHGNVLASSGAGEGHMVIDPHGLLGETAYECAAMLRNGLDWTATATELSRALDTRLAVLSETLDLDRRRIAGWGFAQNTLSACWEALATGSAGDSSAIEVARNLRLRVPGL